MNPGSRPNRRTAPPARTDALTGTGDIGVTGGGREWQILDDRPRDIWAKITGHVTGNKYDFVRVDDGFGTYPELAGATERSEGGAVPCFEVSGRDDVPTDGTAKVRLFPNRTGPGYTFTYGGSTPTDCAGGRLSSALRQSHCLKATLISSEGACGCATPGQSVYLGSNDGLTWTAGESGGGGGGGGESVDVSACCPDAPPITGGTVYLSSAGGSCSGIWAGGTLSVNGDKLESLRSPDGHYLWIRCTGAAWEVYYVPGSGAIPADTISVTGCSDTGVAVQAEFNFTGDPCTGTVVFNFVMHGS